MSIAHMMSSPVWILEESELRLPIIPTLYRQWMSMTEPPITDETMFMQLAIIGIPNPIQEASLQKLIVQDEERIQVQ